MFRRSFASLGKSLVLAEFVNGVIAPATLSAITAAAAVGPVTALVAGKDKVREAAAALAKTSGVAEVLVSEGEHYASGLPEELAPLVDAVVKAQGFSHVFAGTSAFGKNVIPRAAALQKCMPVSEITAVHDENTFTRQMYAGNVIATVKSSDAVKYCTVRQTAFERAVCEGGSASSKDFPPLAPLNMSKVVENKNSSSDRPDLNTAPIVVTGGRGVKAAENFKVLYDLADPLHAAVGATRAVVDAGFVPNDLQVGQTGKTVAPNLYIACGVSGAIQHVAGMKDSKVIVVVNSDEDAPFFQIADYGIVDDLFKVVPALTDIVKSKK